MVAAGRRGYQGEGVTLKRYMSIDHIYIEKIADTIQAWCGWDEESDWLKLVQDFHDKGYSWKVIYFALTGIFSYSYSVDNRLLDINERPCLPCGKNYNHFVESLEQVAAKPQDYTCAEEFFYSAIGAH